MYWHPIYVDAFASKTHFLRYTGWYVRRPPIAQYRFVKITDREVRFWSKDKILKRRVNIAYTREEFVATLAEHVPDRYQHGIRYFGLLAPPLKRADIGSRICAIATTEATLSASIRLGVLAKTGLWKRSHH